MYIDMGTRVRTHTHTHHCSCSNLFFVWFRFFPTLGGTRCRAELGSRHWGHVMNLAQHQGQQMSEHQ